MKLPRRTFLRGVRSGLTTALALPVLEAMLDTHGEALADGSALPLRFGVWFWGNGAPTQLWRPTGAGAQWQAPAALAPLATPEIKPLVNVTSGFKTPGALGDHYSSKAAVLSGDVGNGDIGNAGLAASVPASPSADQVAADHLGADTTFKSIEVGVSQQYAVDGAGYEAVSWRDGTPLPVEFDPRKLFDRMFAVELNTDEREERSSILDAVLADAQSLRTRLGSSDAQRVDAHLDALRAIEKRLDAEALACFQPQAPPSLAELDPNGGGNEPILEVSDLMHELLSIALACDLTRVFSLRFTAPVSDAIFTEIGMTDGVHTITHNGDANVYADVVAFAMERFADLVGRLAAISEGAGTLLDHCALMATTDLSDGYDHTVDDFPLVTAGTANGLLRSGIHVAAPGRNAADVALTLLQAVGTPVESIGVGEARATSVVTDLLA